MGVDAGDFNGDGRTDILWRNNDGTVTDWLGTSAGGFTANSAAAITDAIYDDFLSAFPRAAIEKTLGVYKETVFLKDNIITEDAYNRMTAIMGDGRQFSNDEIKTVPYSRCVNMSFVRKARGL